MTPNIRLSRNFTLRELTRSNTAKRLAIDNTPSDTVILNLLCLARNILQPLRDHIGEPLIINSGYRSPALNAAVGGVKNSQHITGEAVDIKAPDRATALNWLVWISLNLSYDQVLLETNGSYVVWLHVSCRRDTSLNRRDMILDVRHRSAPARKG